MLLCELCAFVRNGVLKCETVSRKRRKVRKDIFLVFRTCDTAGKLGSMAKWRWKCPANFSLSLVFAIRPLPKATTN